MSKTKNVFISHRGLDDKNLQDLRKRLGGIGYNIRNYSVDSTKHTKRKRPSDAVIYRFLRRQISWAGTFICLIGENTHTSKYVNYEIRQAHLQQKRIVGIYKHGCKDNVELPETFKKYGGPLLGWNSLEKLGNVLDGENLPNENPDGSPSPPMHKRPTIKCNKS